ncbi:MAG: hypothetical protein AAGD14_08510 [Planctomycetota bacterium]
MHPTQTDLLLRRALKGNAAFSLLCGSALLAGGDALAPLLGVPALALRVVGLTLLPFAVGLWRNASRAAVSRGEAWTAVALDLVWVAGSIALVAFELWPLEPAGTWAVIGVADVVALWALLQTLGLVRSRPEPVAA